jgi:hypothetical protein
LPLCHGPYVGMPGADLNPRSGPFLGTLNP